MGIDHLELSSELIAALYPETLVIGNDPQAVKKTGKNPSAVGKYPFLGRNLRSICFLVNYPHVEFIPEEQLAFLLKILTACKCSLDDIALINTANSPVQLDELKSWFGPKMIFLWGAIPALTGLTRELQDMTVSLQDGISVVLVSQVNTMTSDSKEGLELKQRLWTCLKNLFNL
jgi:hypothetical protein